MHGPGGDRASLNLGKSSRVEPLLFFLDIFLMHMPEMQAIPYFDSGGISNPAVRHVDHWFGEW
jgi:hypothetical protein